MNIEKIVDVRGISERKFGYEMIEDMIKKVRIGELGIGNRKDDGKMEVEKIVIKKGRGKMIINIGNKGNNENDEENEEKIINMIEMIGKIVEIEIERMNINGNRRGFLRIDVLGRILEKRKNVENEENKVGNEIGIELIKRINILEGGDKIDRIEGDGENGKRREKE